VYGEYDPISLFERNSYLRINTQVFQKIGLSKMYSSKTSEKCRFDVFFKRSILMVQPNRFVFMSSAQQSTFSLTNFQDFLYELRYRFGFAGEGIPEVRTLFRSNFILRFLFK
jgi:hypothetical protein